jgi:hypothetical protein
VTWNCSEDNRQLWLAAPSTQVISLSRGIYITFLYIGYYANCSLSFNSFHFLLWYFFWLKPHFICSLYMYTFSKLVITKICTQLSRIIFPLISGQSIVRKKGICPLFHISFFFVLCSYGWISYPILSRQSTCRILRTGRFTSRKIFSCFSVRGWVNPRPMMQMEGLGKWKKFSDLIGTWTCDLRSYYI